MTRAGPADDGVVELEVAFAAQAEALLSQERTQRLIRATAVAVAVIVIALSAATLAYVVTAVGKASDAAEAAAEAAEGNRKLLDAFRAAEDENDTEDVRNEAAARERLAKAIAALDARAAQSDRERTAQLQTILDLLVAEVRAAENREQRQDRPTADHRHPHPRPSSSPRPRPSSSSSPRPTPTPSPSPSCSVTVAGLCLPPPPQSLAAPVPSPAPPPPPGGPS